MPCVDGRPNQLVDASISDPNVKLQWHHGNIPQVAARKHERFQKSWTPLDGEGPKTDSCQTHGTKASSPYEPLLRGTCEPSEVLCGRR